MWRKLPNSLPFFLSFTKENGYCIYITDYIKIWWVHYKEDEFLDLLKKSNDDLEVNDNEKFIQLGLEMLSQPENLKKVEPAVKDKTLNVLMTMASAFPLYLDMQLTEGSREMFFNKITQPLLKTIQDLKVSESELRSSLLKKDKEIEEYRSETDVRLAMYLKTATFNDEEHIKKHSMYEAHFGTSVVANCLLENSIEETEDQVAMKQENQVDHESRVKVEVDSQNPSTLKATKRELKNSIINQRKKVRKMMQI